MITVPNKARTLLARWEPLLFLYQRRYGSPTIERALILLDLKDRKIKLKPWKLGHYYTRGNVIRTPKNYLERTPQSHCLSLTHELMHALIERREGKLKHGAAYVFSSPYRLACETVCNMQLARMAAVLSLDASHADDLFRAKAEGMQGCKYALPYGRAGQAFCLDAMRRSYADQLLYFSGAP